MRTSRLKLPADWKARAGWGFGSAVCAAIFLGVFASGALAWNTAGYWLFVLSTGILSFAMCKMID
jgi:hypothetical protein